MVWRVLEREGESLCKNSARETCLSSHPLRVSHRSTSSRSGAAASNANHIETTEVAPDHQEGVRASVLAGEDPLSGLLLPASSSSSATIHSRTTPLEDLDLESLSWKTFRDGVKAEYCLHGNVKFDAKYLKSSGRNGIEESHASRSTPSLSSSRNNLRKSKLRLEHLEAHAKLGKREWSDVATFKVVMTQKEYTDRIQRFEKGMKAAWEQGNRVQTLRIAIQCVKMLSDTSSPEFYPSMWVQVVHVLEVFGQLVFDRILSLVPGAQQDNFTQVKSSHQVPPIAKETCRNWLFKIACIRELLPRLYIEMALLQCYRFVAEQEYPSIVGRLAGVIRGIGSPLIAIYCRAFLFKEERRIWTGLRLRCTETDERKKRLFSCFADYLHIMKEYRQKKAPQLLVEHGITEEQYIHVHRPAIELMLRTLAFAAKRDDFDKVLDLCESFEASDVVFSLMLECFPSSHYSDEALSFIRRLGAKHLDPVVCTKIFTKLTEGYLKTPPPPHDRETIFREMWVVARAVQDIQAHAAFACAYIRVELSQSSQGRVFEILKFLLDRLNSEEGRESLADEATSAKVSRSLEVICQSMCDSAKNSDAILTNELLMALLDKFKSDKKTKLCKSLLRNFVKAKKKTSDPVVIHALFTLSRNLHDTIDALTLEEEVRDVSVLVAEVLDHVEFTALEQHFSLLIDFRAAFPNLDLVIQRTVFVAAQLAVKAHASSSPSLSKRTNNFVKSIMAFCMITIPSVNDVIRRLVLFRFCGQVALMNGLLPQTDSFFKHAIMGILEVPKRVNSDPSGLSRSKKMVASEPRLVDFVCSLAAALLPVPGHPMEGGAFSLVHGLIQVVETYPEWELLSGAKTKCKLKILALLAGLGQAKLQIQIAGVNSNDSLFGKQPAYIDELNELCRSVIDAVKEDIAELQAAKEEESEKPVPETKRVLAIQRQVQALSFELVQVLLAFFCVDGQNEIKLICKLVDLVRKEDHHKNVESLKRMLLRLLQSTRLTLSEVRSMQQESYEKLLLYLDSSSD